MARILVGLFYLTAGLGWCIATTQAEVTIDFESVSGSGCPAVPLQGPAEITTQGITFYPGGDPPALLTCDSTESLAASNDSHYLLSGAEPIIGLGSIQVQRRTPSGDRLPFSVLAFDATELLVAAPGAAIRVYALDDSENIVADQNFVFDGAIDGPGGVADFETFVLSASFRDVFAVTFQGTDLSSGPDYYAIDNLVIAVPEPQLPTLSAWTQLALVTTLIGTGIGVWRWRAA